MVETVKSYTKIEKLIYTVAESQKFMQTKDKLTILLDKYSDYLSDELSEDELSYAVAAKMPEIPKYKSLEDV